jgi:8-amino-7-oxononanoate synthase
MAYDPLEWIDGELQQLERTHLRRFPRLRGSHPSRRIVVDGRSYLNFSSNDYLGLAGDRRLTGAVEQALSSFGWGSGASPLVTGRSALHAELERNLAAFEGTQAALLFPSGFAANAGTLASLAGREDLIFSDAHNHASLIDGCRLSRARVEVYPHQDLTALQRGLQDASSARRRLIVTDSLFSMDGDLAQLPKLVDLAETYRAILVVDEAHATGVFGPSGRGVCELQHVESAVPVRIGTLSKGLGSIGGFVTGERRLIDWLFNRARPYVFSTATPAAACAAALAALRVVRDEPQRRTELQNNAAQLRDLLCEQGWCIGASTSQIIPLIVGDPRDALAWADRLQAEGILVPAIRPPTVPAGSARLRISLTYLHRDSDRQQLLDHLGRLRDGRD